jgi:hypothetical protein
MSYDNPRIQLTDSTMDVLMKMSDGNPGALHVLVDVLQGSNAIDPQDVLGGLGAILSLDTYDVYGSEIYILYKYVCKQIFVNFLAFLRAVQLGITSKSELHSAIKKESIDPSRMDELLAAVKDQLSEFDRHDTTVKN